MTAPRTAIHALDAGLAAEAARTRASTPPRPAEQRAAVGRRALKADIVFDISRLLSRTHFDAPTGVDRVEMAYARRLLDLAPERLTFSAVHPCGLYGHIPAPAVARFLDETARNWRDGRAAAGPLRRAFRRIEPLARLMPRPARAPIAERYRPRVYLQVSPHHLDQLRRTQAILAREQARFVCLIHDLIPIEYPEHARPQGLGQHLRRMETIARLADGVIATSETVRRSFLDHLGRDGRTARVAVAPLGVEPPPQRAEPPASTSGQTPYFVAVGTIEPRKNHLLLLNLWRRFAEEQPKAEIPKLILIGRRGWENENILDMLERCPGLKGVVEERGRLSDEAMWPVIRGARALLMPSFAEGFGLPVIEALQLGAPVLCSDIPAHREVGGEVPEFLDPLDGPGWKQAILDYAAADSARRADQLRRLPAWRAPNWEDHVDTALELIDQVCE